MILLFFATVSSGITLSPAAASITTTAGTPALRFTQRYSPSAASISTSAATPTIRQTQRYAPAIASISTASAIPQVRLTQRYSPSASNISTTAASPSVRFFFALSPSPASISTTTGTPSLRFTNRFSPAKANIATTTGTPTVTGVTVQSVPPVSRMKWRPKRHWEAPYQEKYKTELVFDLEAPASELLILCTSRPPRNTLALILETRPAALDVKAEVDNDIAEAIEILLQV